MSPLKSVSNLDTNSRLSTGFLAFDCQGVLTDWNKSMPAGLPFPTSPDVMEQACLEDIFSYGIRIIGPDGVCSAKQAIQTLQNGPKPIVLDLPEQATVTLCGMGNSFGGRSYVLTPFAMSSPEDQTSHAQEEADLLIHTIVEASPTPFLVSRVDDGKIIYCPPASRERFGDLTTTLGFFLSPEHRQTYLKDLLPTGHLDNYPVRFRKQDGSIMEGLTSARVIDLKGEKVIVSSTRDMTEHYAMQAELEKQRELALQNEKLSALGALLAGVAHELNNPLSIVVGYALMLQDKMDDPVLQRRVERIGQAAERCTRIVRTFLAMARQRPTEIEHCSINELLEIAVEVAGYGLRSIGADLRLNLAPDLPHVAVDGDQIVQVFTNLIVNAEHAVRHLGENGQVTLISRLSEDKKSVVVDVQDNGEGISNDIQKRIFEPFFTTKDVGAGTGIGLAFCHRIIDTHGGKLLVHSQPGHGACFQVTLKASDEGAQISQQDQTRPDQNTGLRVLSIDDEVSVTELISDILQDAGYHVTTCNAPLEALNLLQKQTFDAVISDMRMPGMDGAEFLKEVRRLSPDHVKRLGFVTGDAMSDEVHKFLENSNRPALEKPITPHNLIAFIETLSQRAKDMPDA